MSEQPSAPPSDEDVRAAELVLEQHRAAKAAARRDGMAPLLSILGSTEFADAMVSVEELNDPSLSAHLAALQAGAEQLTKIGARDAVPSE